jgi:hypothetical protein
MLLNIKEQIGPETVIVGNLNTPPSSRDNNQTKINKNIIELNNTMDEIDITDIYRVFHSTTVDLIFFSEAHGTCSKINHILDHKANLNKYKNIYNTLYLNRSWNKIVY